MRAAMFDATGPAAEVLRVVDLADPEPARGEVRVRLRTSGVNPSDCYARQGSGLPMAAAYQIPGQDGGGEIDAVGEGVDPGVVGQRVWVYHAALGRSGGTAAQYVTVPAEQAVPLPAEVGYTQAAGLGIPFMTAHRCLFADGPIDGQDILVAGGAGAVGNAAIQLAKHAGARVITTVSSSHKAEVARAAGADEVIVDYTRSEVAGEIRALAPSGVHRLIEVALDANLALDLDVLAPGGTVVSYARGRTDPVAPLLRLMAGNVQLRFVLIYTTNAAALRHAVNDITEALHADALQPLPVVRHPLDDIAEAHDAVEASTFGKVIVDIP
ncbi:MAG TPA: NADPH:quinone reductase [Actinocatenispora sp.]